MSYASITTANGVYNETSSGKYVKSGLSFGDPEDYFLLRPNTSKKTPSITVTRTKQFDRIVGNSTVRVSCSVTTNMTIPTGFPIGTVDLMASDVAEFVSSATISEMLQGKN